jgi:DNA-binding PadR family transcriptional regulator
MSHFDLNPINADGTIDSTQGHTLKAAACVRDSCLSQGPKLVLLMLVLRARPTYEEGWIAFPSVATLAGDCSLGQRAVYRALTALEAEGFIHIEHGGGREVNVYEVNMPLCERLRVREQLRKKREKRKR